MKTTIAAAVALIALGAAGSASADSGSDYPHEFKQNNMGYCAPFLAQQRLPDGSPVRPWINHVVQELTAGNQAWLGFDNYGDFVASKARSTTDTQCLQRQV